MTKSSRIPLFPLDVVLLPAMLLPLHIFEPRYKIMIRRCMDEPIAFGMVLTTNQGMASVGCTARVLKKVKEYEDGRMDILTEGSDVFRLAQLIDEKEYHEGEVEYLTDDALQVDAAREKPLIELFEACHQQLYGQNWGEAAECEPGQLAYRMAARLPADLQERQALLEMRSEKGRREFLENWISEFMPKFAQRQRMRNLASGNGHGQFN